MKKTLPLFFFVCFLFMLPARCFATWSIIVADPKTGEIGIAGASCTISVYGIGLIVPGKGAIVVQAASNPLARLQGSRMIRDGVPTASILDKIRQPGFDPEEQQYAVFCLYDADHPATYTGAKTTGHKGSITGKGITVQGNTLTRPEALKAIFEAALKARNEGLPVQDILMLALEAGAEAGGDKRCGERKASSAFLSVARPGDVKAYWLNLIIYGKDQRTHAVSALRREFDQWKTSGKRS